MKKYIRNPRQTEADDVRSQKRKAVLEQENGQQDQQPSEENGE
jgi:hypothetical protein